MKTSFISSWAMANQFRSALQRSQNDMIAANKEMTTSRHADVGLALGSRTGQTVALRNQYEQVQGLIDTNQLVADRLSVSQSALDSLLKKAQDFRKTLISGRTSASSAAVATEAKNNLQALIGAANSSSAGQYLFAGINTQAAPMRDYGGAPPSASKQAIDAAFKAHFGFDQKSASAATITAAEMKAFIDTKLAPQFADPAWRSNWSSADDRNLTAMISTNEIAEVSGNTNSSGFRNLAKAYAMISEFAAAGLNDNAYQQLVDDAVATISNAITGLISEQARLGSTEARVKSAKEQLTIQRDIMIKQVKRYEEVDPYEAKVRLDALETQIKTAYELTTRMQSLSLLNYLR